MNILELPWELLEAIFALVDASCLGNAALTCRSFHLLVHHFQFSKLTIGVDLTLQELWEASTKRAEPDSLINIYAKLEFYNRSEISSRIQSCTFQCHPREARQYQKLRAIFMSSIITFSNLRNLILSGLVLDSKSLGQMARLQPLTVLYLEDCRLDFQLEDVEEPSKIVASELAIGSCHGHPVGKPRWLSLFDDQRLTVLRLLTHCAALDVLTEASKTDNVLTALHTLILCGEDSVISSTLLPLALPAFQNVTKLHILPCPRRVTGPPLPAITSLMVLTTYEGPHYHLRSLLQEQRNLQRVRLWGRRWEMTCDIVDILEDVGLLHRYAPDLETMQLQAFPTKGLCAAIAALLPKLKSLYFFLPFERPFVGDPMQSLTQQDFLPSVIEMKLGPNIQRLAVDMLIYNEEDGFEALASLTGNYPYLRRIHLHFPGDYGITWISTPAPRGEDPDPRDIGVERGITSSGNIHDDDWF
ncbi:hypothetical protein C8J56DRAFT_935105 [Mycena floridula]|nr:hypothetical protein C8J56DRAFT_935105 [Mycena floridula]